MTEIALDLQTFTGGFRLSFVLGSGWVVFHRGTVWASWQLVDMRRIMRGGTDLYLES